MKKNYLVRLLVVLLCAVMCISLFACNTPAENETASETESGQDNGEVKNDLYYIYEELVAEGYEGTYEEWVESLKGEDGKSAYELAVANGYSGTEAEWIASLAGDKGEDGKSAYELAVEEGYDGSLEEWLVTLSGKKGEKGDKGAKGDKGDKGDKGENGVTPHIGLNGNWFIGNTDTGIPATGSGEGGVVSNSIISLNKDMEPYVIQAASGRPEAFGDKYKVLQFVHASDMHKRLDMWNRMVQWINYYDQYVSFAIHTGDYVGGTQAEFVDMYADGNDCDVPILNLPGNHDTMLPGVSKQQTASKQSVYDIICGEQCKDWGVTFMPGEYSMAYYKDFPESNIRLIALDQYYDIEEQKVWLKGLLDEALAKDLHVITAMHEPSGAIAYPLDTSFHTYNYDLYSVLGKHPIEDVISEFINNGGVHIVNLVGHEHHDLCGYTMGGVLNIAVESGTPWEYWCDGVRVEGTKTFDAFNVVSVDVNAGVLKVIRIGNNTDPYMRTKEPLCYDYINKKIVAGGTVEGDGSSSSGMPEDTYEVPEYVNKYLNAKYLAVRPTGATYQVKDDGLKSEDGVLYTRIFGQDKVGQIFWTRIGFDGTGAPWPAAQINPIEVGKAQYLVLKMRGQVNVSNVSFAIGTIVGDATPENIDNMKLGNIYIPQSKLSADEWTYFVFDLAGTYEDFWVADSEGNYKVCYLQFTFNGTFASDMYVDLASMAFLDDWKEVSDYLEVDTAEMVYASNASIEVDVATGKCKNAHALAETVSGRTYKYACALCGSVAYEKTVPESVNWYSPLSAMNLYQNKLEYYLYDAENDIIFNRYSGTRGDHLNITGGKSAGSPTSGSFETGNYLVMKYRASSDGSIGLNASTDGSRTLVGAQDATDLPANEWRVAVIDLSHVSAYARGTTAPIYIMLTTGGTYYTFDIAYAAVVDSVDEARALITDETYYLYTGGWSNYKSYVTETGLEVGAGENDPADDPTETPKETEPASADFQLSAEDIETAANGNGYALGTVEKKNDGGFDYVRVYNNDAGTANAYWAHSYADAEGVSGRYLIFKYRTNVTSGWVQFATSTDELVDDYFLTNTQRSWYVMPVDENWHVVIVDLSQSVADSSTPIFTADANGNYTAKFIGFRPFYNSAANADAYMDFAYVKWAVTMEEALEVIGTESNIDAGYYSGGKWFPVSTNVTQ